MMCDCCVQVFDGLRAANPGFKEKVVGISGELTEEHLGISDEDYQHLIDKYVATLWMCMLD